jgi:hypothetical protein
MSKQFMVLAEYKRNLRVATGKEIVEEVRTQ